MLTVVMTSVERVYQAIRYIEENIREELRLDELAGRANLSPYHFHRLFGLVVGEPPISYVRKRRLYLAYRELAEGRGRIVDIALDYGYGSAEAFSRAFTRQFGVNPRDYKSNRELLMRYPKPTPSLEKLLHFQKGLTMTPSIVEEREKIVVGVLYYGRNEEGEIPTLWDRRFPDVASLPGRVDPTTAYGLCFHDSEYLEKGIFSYMAAVETRNADDIPLTAVAKRIPAHTYAVFTHTEDAAKLGETYEYIYGTWFPHKNYVKKE